MVAVPPSVSVGRKVSHAVSQICGRCWAIQVFTSGLPPFAAASFSTKVRMRPAVISYLSR